MIYRILRWISGVALYWFYREIRIVGKENIPVTGPLLIAVNHQNALVDSLIVGWVAPRRITMTAKATLVENPLIAALFRMVGVVPLRRITDESRKAGGPPDQSRNANAFREILRTLGDNGAVLIFPEGKSHNGTGLEPLRSGLARVALQACHEQSIRNVRVLPIGLVFGDKGTPGSIVGVRVGREINLDSWTGSTPAELTEEIAQRLRSVSETELPPPAPADSAGESSTRRLVIAMAAAWGRLMHRVPVRIARTLAVKQGGDADQPAMLTIMFGISLVLLTYVAQLAVVGALVHSFWISSLYLASLVSGAYWAAFEKHPQRH